MTILYIKTHNITGLRYFGKTQKEDPFTYNGSGLYWKRHIKKYGNSTTTQIYARFDETDYIERMLLEGCALMFSFDNNITDSKDWANMKPENGLDGAVAGSKLTKETKDKISNDRYKIMSNGKTKGKNSGELGRKTRTETIQENGKTIQQNAGEKSAKTKQKIQENGKTIAQNNSIRAAKTKAETVAENGKTIRENTNIKISETRKKNGSSAGRNHHSALRVNIYDSLGALQFECFGDIEKVIEENNLPSCLINSYREHSAIYITHRRGGVSEEKYLKFRGWYALIV